MTPRGIIWTLFTGTKVRVRYDHTGPPGGGVLDISLGGKARNDPSNPDENCPIFDTLFKTFSPKLYPV